MVSIEDTRKRVWRLIEKHEPAKLDSVNGLMKKWKGKENALNRMLSGRFKEKFYPQLVIPLKKKYAVGKKTGMGGFVVARMCKQRRNWKDQVLDERMDAARKKEDAEEKKREEEEKAFRRSGKRRYDDSGKKKKMPKLSLKIIKKVNLESDDLLLLERELNILRTLFSYDYVPTDTNDKKKKRDALGTNENIVKLHDVFHSRHRICIVLDYLDGGELFDRIIEQGNFTEAAAARAFKQLLQALNFMHNLSIAHRDLKPENLIFASRRPKAPLKLIDFSLAKSCKNEPLTLPCGTPNYVAPEIIRRQPYGTECDLWSAGVILYILLCGFPPFFDPKDNLRRLYRRVRHAEYEFPAPYWNNISTFAQDLIKKLLVADPKKRITAEKALKHPWVTGKALDNALDGGQLANLRRFQYIRRFKRGVRCVIAVLKLIEALENAHDYMEKVEKANQKRMKEEEANKLIEEQDEKDQNEFLESLKAV